MSGGGLSAFQAQMTVSPDGLSAVAEVPFGSLLLHGAERALPKDMLVSVWMSGNEAFVDIRWPESLEPFHVTLTITPSPVQREQP